MKGRIVVCKAYNQPFEIEEYDVPDPELGAVVLRMTQAGVCGSDLHAWRGDMVNLPLPPKGRVMGHEGTGMVAMLGAGVRPTRWASHWARATGWCTTLCSHATAAICACGATPTGA